MDIVGTLLQELMTLAGYVLLFLVVYKLFQINAHLSEMKDRMARGSTSFSAPPQVPGLPHAAHAPDSGEYADAAAYAENLLRAVNAESKPEAEVPTVHGEPR